VKDLVSRVVLGLGRFDYWESEMGIRFGRNMFESFVKYQTRLIHLVDRLARRYDIEMIDAGRQPDEIFHHLQTSAADSKNGGRQPCGSPPAGKKEGVSGA